MNVSELLKAAAKVRGQSHAPYSGDQVGAAVLSSTTQCYTGVTVENASYGLTAGAVRAALAAMVAAGEQICVNVAIAAEKAEAPDGETLQAIAEFGSPRTRLHLMDAAGGRIDTTLGELMPGLAPEPAADED